MFLAEILFPVMGVNLCSGSAYAMEESSYLDPAKRPENLKKEINTTFSKISSNLHSWSWNGSLQYEFIGIDPAKLLKSIIKSAPKGQKEFYVLDIGAGDCS